MKHGFLVFLISGLAACSSNLVERGQPVDIGRQELVSSAPSNIPLNVAPGENIYTYGFEATVSGLQLAKPFNGKMPGTFGVPFSFSLRPTILVATRASDSFIYYCAPFEDASATFSAAGSVIAPGDCVGVRESKLNGSTEWIVDNSIYNNSRGTLWHRPVRAQDGVTFKRVQVSAPSIDGEISEISYDGFYDGKLHFSHRRHTPLVTDVRDFKFEYEPGEQLNINVMGKAFRILDVNSTELTYQIP